jgi:hypothetical protein
MTKGTRYTIATSHRVNGNKGRNNTTSNNAHQDHQADISKTRKGATRHNPQIDTKTTGNHGQATAVTDHHHRHVTVTDLETIPVTDHSTSLGKQSHRIMTSGIPRASNVPNVDTSNYQTDPEENH